MTLKQGTGGWRAQAGDYDADARATTYQIEISDDFELVGACTHADSSFVVSEIYGTVDDAEVTLGSWRVPDCTTDMNGTPPPPNDQTITVTGVTDVPATIYLDYEACTALAGQPFSYQTWPGTHDVLVESRSNVLLENGVDLTNTTDLGALSVGAQGTPLLSAALAFAKDPDENALVLTELVTARHMFHYIESTASDSALLVPPPLLAPADVQSVSITLGGRDTYRTTTLTVAGTSVPEVEFLPRLSPVTALADRTGVAWSPIDDDYTSAVVEAETLGAAQFVAASKQWLERHAPGELVLDTNVDGFDPSWQRAISSLIFLVERWSSDRVLSTQIYPTQP